MATSVPPEQWLSAQPAPLRADCQRLLMARCGWSLTDWVTQRNAPLPAALLGTLDEQAKRLAAGEPLAYLLGCAPFRSLMLEVTPDVLIPRPETEELIDHLLPRCIDRLAATKDHPLRVLDLGTGSGAIILALGEELRRAGRLDQVKLAASDRSAAALAVARANGATYDLPVQWHRSHWYEGIIGPFDLLISNPPYLAAQDEHLPALSAEPMAALVAGASGMEDLESLITGAPALLAPAGELWLEHGWTQGEAVERSLRNAGFNSCCTLKDGYGNDRFSRGRWADAAGAKHHSTPSP